jgi:hypothetical protein
MCITLHVSSVKRSSSGGPHRTYSLHFLCLCLSAALSCKKLAFSGASVCIDRLVECMHYLSITSCICWSTYWNIDQFSEVIRGKINSINARNNRGQQVDLKCGYTSKTLLDIAFQKVLILYADKTVILSIQICYSKFQRITYHSFSTLALNEEYKFMFVYFKTTLETYISTQRE